MAERFEKRVDESWKEQVEHQKRQEPSQAPAAPTGTPLESPTPDATAHGEPGGGWPAARFDTFLSSLAMDALMALGDAPNPVTRKQTTNLPQARYMIDLLGILEEKTRGNVTVDEERLLKDTLYQLRMRYLAKSGGTA